MGRPLRVFFSFSFSDRCRRIEQGADVEDGDRRRITSFYYTSVDKTPPIHFAVPRAVKEVGVDGQ